MITPSSHLRELRFISLDLETLGLSPSIDPILEMGALSFRRSGRVTDTFESLCNPGIPIPKRITALTGITDEMVKTGKTIEEVMLQFVALTEGLPTVIVAHGVSTDMSFLLENARRLEMELPPLVAIDTLPLSRLCLPDSLDYKLETLTRTYLAPQEGASFHRAFDDAKHTMQLFLKCLDISPKPLASWGDLQKIRVVLRDPNDRPPMRPIPARFQDLIEWTRKEVNIEFIYRSGSHKGVWRPLEPHTLFQRHGHHYLRGLCALDNTGKDFRLDRITRYRLHVGDDPNHPPE